MFSYLRIIQKISLYKLTAHNLALCVLITLMAVTPILKAGMYPGMFAFMMVCCWLIFALSLADFTRHNYSQQKLKQFWQQYKHWLLVWLVFTLIVITHLSIIPKTIGLNYILLSDNRGWSSLPLTLKGPIDLFAGLRFWAFFSCMWLIAAFVSSLQATRVRIIIYTIIVASSFQVLYGLYLHISGELNVLGIWTKEHYLKDATGTFVNRNHYAGFLAICLPITLAFCLSLDTYKHQRTPKPIYHYWIALAYTSLVLIAITSSHSRMGLTAAIFGTTIMLITKRKLSSATSSQHQGKMVIALIASLILFLLWFGIEDIINRYSHLETGDGRITIWSSIFDMPIIGWFIGAGPGSFHDLYLLLQPNTTSARINFAHNDYLEFIFEVGIVMGLVFLFTLLAWVKALVSKPALSTSLIKIGALGSISAIALHSIVDFNLQIPASAIYFWVAVGLVVNKNLFTANTISELKSNHNQHNKKRRKTKKHRPKSLLKQLSNYFEPN